METTSRKGNKKGAMIAPETRIRIAYIDYLLTHGQRPPSVFKFASELGISEEEFYAHFGSFTGLERQVWKGFIERTLLRLKTDDSYQAFSVREKILAFYYTFFEDMKSDRSFVLLQLEQHNKLELVPAFLRDYKTAFQDYIEGLMTLGKGSGEIAKRPYLERGYGEIFWMHMAFLLIFWKEDNSPAFEQTDAAIEKSVNLAFDLIGKGAVDSAFDFAKFLYHARTK